MNAWWALMRRFPSVRLSVKGHMNQGQERVPNKGRWAHDNVKLLRFVLFLNGHLKQ